MEARPVPSAAHRLTPLLAPATPLPAWAVCGKVAHASIADVPSNFSFTENSPFPGAGKLAAVCSGESAKMLRLETDALGQQWL